LIILHLPKRNKRPKKRRLAQIKCTVGNRVQHQGNDENDEATGDLAATVMQWILERNDLGFEVGDGGFQFSFDRLCGFAVAEIGFGGGGWNGDCWEDACWVYLGSMRLESDSDSESGVEWVWRILEGVCGRVGREVYLSGL
jgi:hypothetical protein